MKPKDNKNPGEQMISELHDIQNEEFRAEMAHSATALVARGYWELTQTTCAGAAGATVLFQARYGDLPTWARFVLGAVGLVVLGVALWNRGKLLKSVGESQNANHEKKIRVEPTRGPSHD